MRSILDSPAAWTALLVAAIACAAAGGACVVERERPAGGVHPAGWTDARSRSFHGVFLKQAGYPLGDCRVCHGDDYAGGPVGSSCVECHQQGVEACDTCHGGSLHGLPATGAHWAHAGLCEDCHRVPEDARSGLHPNGAVEVTFSGLGAIDPTAAWDPGARRCANVYCHGGMETPWEPPAPDLDCNGCHGAPPESHSRWTVGAPPEGCARCHPHPGAASGEHVNGSLDTLPLGCDGCHGKGPRGAPPPALDGSADPGDPGVGAHRRHLDITLDDRIGAPARCEDCHPVPASVEDPGHLDAAAPADVTLISGGHYDAAEQRCTVSCHWDRSPGPRWTDSSGAERACDACHESPPSETRAGTAHPSAQGLDACLTCHTFEPASHVDGHVDIVQ